MKMFVLGITLIILCSDAAMAQVQQFPYEAVVQSDNLELRSGPGRKYYSTSKLNKGDRVTVHRHDPGGWYMVAPLSNSYSWIQADKVQTEDGTTGVVTSNQVSVRVGSRVGNSRDVEQLRVSKGDTVQILERVAVSTTGGKINMYKIVSPRGEYRWTMGQFVIPVSNKVKQQQDSDPFTIPSSAARPATVTEIQTVSNKSWKNGYEDDSRLKGFRVVSNRTSQPSQGAIVRQQKYLNDCDQRLRETLKREPSEWELSKHRKEYETLSTLSVHKSIQSRVQQRLETLKKYQHIKDEYDGFMGVMNKTDQKDKELTKQLENQIKTMALPSGATIQNPDGSFEIQQGNTNFPIFQGGLPPLPTETETFLPSAPLLVPNSSQEASMPPRLLAPSAQQPETSRVVQSVPQQQQIIRQRKIIKKPSVIQQQSAIRTALKPIEMAQSNVAVLPKVEIKKREQALPQFDSAGIVRRASNWTPQRPHYVLVQPNGRLVIHLHSVPSINLEQAVGKSVGLHGKRYRRSDLRVDLLVVNKITPVRLVPKQ
ncbi:hypothetical protein MNBD_PLANCTO02-1745 [hydrothermal vent metagenome]|uniref:SH3b domain-containing protein n=1 Tax=hydrothermal vent metagenome TaxID=652676 RepID=A0A3B1DZQ7_9ZZZZ